ncbi:MAG: hypothetical protein A2X35_10470 [Elusimicrobia bacterium GWA2_61_42]|nr:MAG: hypothetical protein A2X35_10470 [Elusimicrobia bacterium GWA2_61_42]OGR74684.1 MAG: hypothetical protein A2X38_02435 [Elusimicrobia bacterium GWC2_61_25]
MAKNNGERAFLERLADHYPPLRALMVLGGHQRMSAGRVFLSFAVVDAVRRLRSFGFSGAALDRLFVKHQQAVTHHPNFLANPCNPKINILSVCLTYHCDRSCSFCYAKGLQNEFREHMSLADFDFLAGWARSQGWLCMRLLGGEPTQHPQFAQILDIAARHGLTIYVTTNGLFDARLNAPLGKSFVRSVCFSYPQDGVQPRELEAFRRNFKRAVDNGRTILALSWVIQPENDGWRQVVDLAKESHTRSMVRFSMALPGHSRNFGPGELRQRLRTVAAQIVEIARYAQKQNVIFAFYRPLLLCMFEPEQLALLKAISPFLFYTRCPLCLKGEYDTDLKLTVNPDLSCYPCTALAVKGVKIAPGVTRTSLNERFSPLLREMTARPLMKACEDCQFFANYKSRLGDKPQDLADRTVCQGGCFQYRV